jgi:hypothetical protein
MLARFDEKELECPSCLRCEAAIIGDDSNGDVADREERLVHSADHELVLRRRPLRNQRAARRRRAAAVLSRSRYAGGLAAAEDRFIGPERDLRDLRLDVGLPRLLFSSVDSVIRGPAGFVHDSAPG